MITYTLSYFVKGATEFEEGATVIEMGNGWFRVVKVFDAPNDEEAIKHAQERIFPFNSAGHILEIDRSLSRYTPPKPKRKAAWKQNPLARFAIKENQ
jgi:hypothetical protein